MKLTIVEATMKKDENGGYLGITIFRVESHKVAYEITFFSKKGKEWDYSLNYANEPGVEEEFLKLDEALEQDDDLFDTLLDAAWDTLQE